MSRGATFKVAGSQHLSFVLSPVVNKVKAGFHWWKLKTLLVYRKTGLWLLGHSVLKLRQMQRAEGSHFTAWCAESRLISGDERF